jgi:hypothetical protein
VRRIRARRARRALVASRSEVAQLRPPADTTTRMVDPETLAELHRRIDALRWTLSQALNVLSNPDRPR